MKQWLLYFLLYCGLGWIWERRLISALQMPSPKQLGCITQPYFILPNANNDKNPQHEKDWLSQGIPAKALFGRHPPVSGLLRTALISIYGLGAIAIYWLAPSARDSIPLTFFAWHIGLNRFKILTPFLEK